MNERFKDIFDDCVDRINLGERLEDCLASYPAFAGELEPLLLAMVDVNRANTFTPSPVAKSAAKQRLNAAIQELERKRAERRPLFPRLLAWPKAWAAVAVLMAALIGFFGLQPLLFPEESGPQPGPEGNFAFLISDDVNFIGDFQSLNISVSKIGLQSAGETDRWIELEPMVETVDLTLLQGDNARQIWRGDVPKGEYNEVLIDVSNVSGILERTGEPVNVKLPSERLQISIPFEVTGDAVTSFVYEITVIAAGSPQTGVGYLLKPEVEHSGASQKFVEVEGKGAGK